jgi:REP element-mobilizing transposase RayT
MWTVHISFFRKGMLFSQRGNAFFEMGKFTNSAMGTITSTLLSTMKQNPSKHEPLHDVDVEPMNLTDLHNRTLSIESDTNTTPDNEVQQDSTEESDHIVFEPLDQNPYDLSYTCLLIPRFSSHFLIGDLADRLPEWMQQICVSFGWRLEFINVKPDYLQWTMGVPPATSTAYFMKSIRQQTSLFIFEDFPRIKRENVSYDFWAPGYLIYFGTRPHPIEVIRSFIHQTRQQQEIHPHD